MKCVICGKEIEKSMYSNSVLCSSKCFHINFWNEALDDKAIIVNGTCYHDGGYQAHPRSHSFLGHGGAMFHIQKLDTGEEFVTNNLWCNGTIPEDRHIKDNAVFMNSK